MTIKITYKLCIEFELNILLSLGVVDGSDVWAEVAVIEQVHVVCTDIELAYSEYFQLVYLAAQM